MPTKLRESNVFTGGCLSVYMGGPMMHRTSLYSPPPGPSPTPRPLDMGHGRPPTPLQTRDKEPPGFGPLLVSSGGYHWIPVQTCSLDFTVQALPSVTDIWWPAKHVRLTNG